MARAELGLALFGAGRMGTLHARSIARMPDARLLRIVDLLPDRAAMLAARGGAVPSTVADVCADRAIAAVVIATSTPAHVDLAVACMEAGKAVFCEKPVHFDVDEVIRCERAAGRSGAAFAVGFQRRFDPTFAALRRALDDGAIGEVESIRITSRDPSPPSRAYLEQCGGLFTDMMIHDFDVARWLLGEEPAAIFATGSSLVSGDAAALDDFDTAIATLRTSGGRLCVIENSRRAVYGYDQRIEVLGARGALVATNRDGAGLQRWDQTGLRAAPPLAFFPERYAEAYEAELVHFCDAVRNGTATAAGLHDGLRSLQIARAAHRSARSGRLEEIP